LRVTLIVVLSELSKARRFVADGEKCMVRQRKIVDKLEQQGYDTLDAILLLEYLEEMQEQYVAHRNRLEQQVLGLVRPNDD
jgi:hypothetical protein